MLSIWQDRFVCIKCKKLLVTYKQTFIVIIAGGQKNYGSKSSAVKDNNGKSKTTKKQAPVYNEKAMLLSSDEEIP